MRYAFEDHRPSCWTAESGAPALWASVAAPALRECGVTDGFGRPAAARNCRMAWVREVWVRGAPEGYMKRGELGGALLIWR